MPEIVKILLQVPGIDVNAQDLIGGTALIYAAPWGRENVTKLLLQIPKINLDIREYKNGETALMLAAKWDHENIFKLLLDAGANPDLVNSDGKTALDLVNSWKRQPYKKLVNEFHNKEKLFSAAKMPESDFGKASEIIKNLIYDTGMDINERDNYGNTPLMYAAGNKNERLVRFLITLQANPRLKNKWNETAADIAQTMDDSKLATYLKMRAI